MGLKWIAFVFCISYIVFPSMAYQDTLDLCDYLLDGYDHPCEHFDIGSRDSWIPITVFSVLNGSSSTNNTMGSTGGGLYWKWNMNYFLGISTVFVIGMLIQMVVIPAVLNAVLFPYGQPAACMILLQQWYEAKISRCMPQDPALAADIVCAGVYQFCSLLFSSFRDYSSTSGFNNAAAPLWTVSDVFGWTALLAVSIPTTIVISVARRSSRVDRLSLVSRSLNLAIGTLQIIMSLAEKLVKRNFLRVEVFPLALICVDTGTRLADLWSSARDKQPTQQPPLPTSASTGATPTPRAGSQLVRTPSRSRPHLAEH